MLCPCGRAMLSIHAPITAIKVVDIEGARTATLSEADIAIFADNLLKLSHRVGAHLGQDRGIVRANQRRAREQAAHTGDNP